MKRGLWIAGAYALLLHACGGEPRKTVQLETKDECYQRSNQVLCSDAVALTCTDGKVSARTTCGAQLCVDGVGCRVCAPGAAACDGDKRSVCNAAGSALEFAEACAAPLSCSPFGCANLCADAVADRSYLGCDYWPVFTSNSLLDPLFLPAVAIGNGNLVSAHIVISKNLVTVAELDVAPSSAQTVQLSFQPELKDPGGSRLVRQGAYHLTASVPVTVHQFNPLLYEVKQSCEAPDNEQPDGGTADVCDSFTNDASLLFPSSALKQDPAVTDSTVLDFIVASRSSFMRRDPDDVTYRGQGGFVAIVAVGDSPVNVTVRSTAFTQPSPLDLDSDQLESLAPGGTLTRMLSPGDVLQLVSTVPSDCSSGTTSTLEINPDLRFTFCDPGNSFDLTGSEISADGPIQVIAGHDCANVPFDRVACDHLEESMVPLHAWGTNAVVTVPPSAAGAHYALRLISGADNNVVSFDPPLHDPVTLTRNQSLELIAEQSTVVQGTGRLMVAQFFLGQQNLNVGDPSMTVAVPVDQYRASYNFISPATYVRDYVDIIASLGDVVVLDGKLVNTFSAIGQSSFGTATVELTVPGAHEIHGVNSAGIAIVLYGLAPYTAYLLPGGLDLYPIGPIGI